MTPLQEKILYVLRNIHNEQKTDSQYFVEGTSIDNLGLVEADVAKELAEMEANGHVKTFTLKTGKQGVLLTPLGLGWVTQDDLTKRQALDAQALIDAQVARAKEVNDFLTEAQNLGWKITK